MKCFSITTLLCVVTLNAGFTKEHVEAQGYRQNWEKNSEDLIVTKNSMPLFTIDKSHIPANEVLPLDTKIYFPVPVRNFLQNKHDISFETNGTFEEGQYFGPERNSDRLLWSKIKDTKGTILTVPTARLMILLGKQQLESAGYQENWKERPNGIEVATMNGSAYIDKNHIPARNILPQKAEVFFPVPARDYLKNKEDSDFVTDGTFKHGYYCQTETSSSRILWSIVEDDNGKRHTVPTARLMINRRLFQEITSPLLYKETYLKLP